MLLRSIGLRVGKVIDLWLKQETQMTCDLREQIKLLQREMLELKILVKSCVDFQKSMQFESLSGE